MNPDDFTLVVVLHDSAAELEHLLESLDRRLPVRPHLVAVDTGSTDGGPDLARGWGAEVLDLPAPTGFGAANNAGVARVHAPVTVLLNPDVRLPDGGLTRLAALASQSDALLVPRLLNLDGTVQRSAHPAPGAATALAPALLHARVLPARARLAADPWRSTRPRRVGWAIAAALAARTQTLHSLGPFDPDPFLFFEDMDLCLRAAQRGVPTVLEPSVALFHAGGHSTEPHYGGEPHELIATRRREVVGERLGSRALALDDAAQALTFAARIPARAAAGRDARRPAAQLRALLRARRAAGGRW